MPNQKITELTADTSPSSDDLVILVDDPTGTPTNKKATLSNLGKGFGTVYATVVTGTQVFADEMTATAISGVTNIYAITITGTQVFADELTAVAISGVTNIYAITITGTQVFAEEMTATAISGVTIVSAVTVTATTVAASELAATNISGATNIWSSSLTATTVDCGALTSLVAVISTGGNIDLAASQTKGQLLIISAAATATLPAVVIGSSITVYSLAAAAVVVDPNANDRIILDGTAGADGKKITSASGSGDLVTLVGDSADGWIVIGRSGTWTLES